jgi:predicted small metal-binding protein
MKEFACRDVGMDCDFKVRGETEEEVLKNAEMHGLQDHGMKELTEDVKMKIRSVIHDVPSEQPQTKIA